MLRNNCRACAIRDKALCRALPESALVQLNQLARRRKVRAGARLLDDSADMPLVANIVSGVVRLSKSLPDGRTQIVGLQFPAEFVGRPFDRDRTLVTEAATSVELCYFTQRQFEGLLAAHHGLEELLLRRTMEQLDTARDWMLLLGRKTAEERVASLILLCLEKSGDAGCEVPGDPDTLHIELPLSRTEMADYLGLTLETVGRMLKRLAEAGLIAIHANRSLSILDRAGLQARSESAHP